VKKKADALPSKISFAKGNFPCGANIILSEKIAGGGSL
jgi:hypothetical protein